MQRTVDHVSWLVTCDLPAELRKAEDVARREAALDREVVVELQSFPGGHRHSERHVNRLRDYFSNVELDRDNRNTFRLVFHLAANADNFWKDVMVRVLRAILDSSSHVSITRERSA